MKAPIKRFMVELRWPLIVLLLAIILGSVMMSASWYIEHRKDQEYKQAQNRMRAARLALDNIRRDASDSVTFHDRFQTLSKHNIFGEEQRLNWVEYMSALSTTTQLQSLDYEILSQRPVTITSYPQASSIEVLASRIQLRLGLLHDGDLFRIWDELHQSNTGFFRIEYCNVKRKDNLKSAKLEENLSAECRLQWITMRSRGNGK